MKVGYLTIILAAGVTGVPYQIYTQPSDLYCLAEDENPYLQFSTRTAYQVAKNRRPNAAIPNCRPEAAWLLIRHGTRYPSSRVGARLEELQNVVRTVIENHDIRKNGDLCREDLEALRKWRFRYHPSQFDQLASEGRSNLRILAGSYNLSLPELFNNVSPEKMTIRFTTFQRTRDSAQAFLEGLSRNTDWNLSDNNIYDLLETHENCTAWEKSYDSPEASAEKNLYASTPEMDKVIHRISKRLGFLYDIELKTVIDIYDACRTEKAVFYSEQVSPWCAAFTREDLEVLEYYMDLKYYYESGYGNPMTQMLGCPLVRDMLLKLDNVTKNNGTSDAPALTLNFAHSVAMRSVITKLGFARDSIAPRHDNRQAVKDRQWRTSRISPFTANLAAVLYRCTSGEEWKIVFFLNEYLVNYEGCRLGLCDWSYIIDRFRDHIDAETCNTDFCFKTNSAPRVIFPLLTLLVCVLVRLIL